MTSKITRRAFLQKSLIGTGGLLLLPFNNQINLQVNWPQNQKLGRVCRGKVEIKTKPSPESNTVKILYEDAVVVWNREVIGEPNIYRGNNRRWVETPEGYIYAPDLQPVINEPNTPLQTLPVQNGSKGMWAEVTIPYVGVTLANGPAKSLLLKQHTDTPFNLYYSQVFWIDDLRTVNGNLQYRVTEKHGSYGDIFWCNASAFRPILQSDYMPIHPGIDDKRILINLTRQTITCYEGKREVYYCRISSGAKFDATGKAVDAWSTPVGLYHVISRKFISVHMASGTAASGFELFGVSWTSLFTSEGVAIHSTYWHNNYGMPMSHGCINATPKDARWIFLWTLPEAPYDPGKIEVSGYMGTKVQVVEE